MTWSVFFSWYRWCSSRPPLLRAPHLNGTASATHAAVGGYFAGVAPSRPPVGVDAPWPPRTSSKRPAKASGWLLKK
jgi:hypothetical protein